MAILEFHQVSLFVGDLEKALRFYRDALGCLELARLEFGPEAALPFGLAPRAIRTVVLARAGMQLELVAWAMAQAGDCPGPSAPGLFHLTFTDDKGYEYQEPNAILLNQVRGRWSFPQLRAAAKEQYNMYKPDRIIIENKASGQSLLQDLKLNGLPVLPFQPDRDKVARAHAVSGIVERQRVWLPLGKKFAAELLQEALEFPKGAHDDAVDSMVMALLYLRRRYQLTQEAVNQPDPISRRRSFKSYWSQVTHVR